jgi:hypothetical protein
MREQMGEATDCQVYQKKRAAESIPFISVDPLNAEDRAKAVKEVFSSVARDCPFYSEKVRSRCLIDPHVIFMPECFGRSFSNGICCPKIILSSFCK